MESKLIFLDIDGTLAMPGRPAGRRTLAAIAGARENGHKVFLCTGRPVSMIPKEIAAIPTDGGIFVSGGRAVVDGKLIFDKPLPRFFTDAVTASFRKLGVYYEYECESRIYRTSIPIVKGKSNAEIGGYAEIFGQNVDRSTIVSMEEYDGDPVYKIPYITSPAARYEEIEQVLPADSRNVAFKGLFEGSAYAVGEVNYAPNSKADAMDAVCSALGKSRRDCIAFGDSMNDFEIIVAAGVGIAVGNADDALKAEADWICESCEEEGVALELQRRGLV